MVMFIQMERVKLVLIVKLNQDHAKPMMIVCFWIRLISYLGILNVNVASMLVAFLIAVWLKEMKNINRLSIYFNGCCKSTSIVTLNLDTDHVTHYIVMKYRIIKEQ